MNSIFSYLPDFLRGMAITLEVTLLAFALGLVLGVLGALARRSRIWPLRFIGAVYVEVIRNTPSLIQIFFVFFGLPSVGVLIPAFWAGVIALGVNGGAYITEIIRTGLAAVPQGQLEASTTLGLSKRSTFLHVVLPQAFRTVFPPVVNEFIGILLATSLLSTIGLNELTGVAQIVNSQTFMTFEAFTVALVLYLLLSNLIAYLAALFARHAFKPSLDLRRRGALRPKVAVSAEPEGSLAAIDSGSMR